MLVHELIAYGQRTPLNNHVYISSGSGTKGLIFGLSLHLYSHILCMRVSKALVSLRIRVTRAFVAQTNVKFQNLVCWLKYVLASTEMHHLDTK